MTSHLTERGTDGETEPEQGSQRPQQEELEAGPQTLTPWQNHQIAGQGNKWVPLQSVEKRNKALRKTLSLTQRHSGACTVHSSGPGRELKPYSTRWVQPSRAYSSPGHCYQTPQGPLCHCASEPP